MKKLSPYLRIFFYSFISYFSSLLITFLLNLDIKFRPILDNQQHQQLYTLVNYYTIFDLYNAKISHIDNYLDKNVFTSFEMYNSLYLSKIDLYGNLVNSNVIKFGNVNFKAITFEHKKMYSIAVIKSNQHLYSLILDYNVNLLGCQKIRFNGEYRGDLIYLNPEKLGLYLENNKKYILFLSFKPNEIKKNIEFMCKQDVTNIGFEEKFLILNVVSENNNLPFLIDALSYEQYIINPYSHIVSFCSNKEYIFLVLKKYDNSQYLLKISKENKKLEQVFEIRSGIFMNFKIVNFQNYIVLNFNYENDTYLVFINSEGKIDKTVKLTNIPIDYTLYTNHFGIFLTFSYKSFPLLLRFDNRIENYSTEYFSIQTSSELPISLVNSSEFSIGKINYLIKSDEVETYLERTEPEIKKEEILLRYYSTF